MIDISTADHAVPLARAPHISEASVGDYVALLKPRVMSLVVFTALVGLMVAPTHVHPMIGFTALLCIAVGAGAAGADKPAMQLFAFSILYLFVLFAVLLVESGLGSLLGVLNRPL